jgi:hypothetical protein
MSMFAVMGVTVSAAGAAARPHTIGQPIVDIDSSGNLSVHWKVAGLGNFTSAAFLTADREAVYGCDNPGVGAMGFRSRRGSRSSSLTSSGRQRRSRHRTARSRSPWGSRHHRLRAQPGFCPGSNWNVVLVSITYVNVVLHIQQEGVDVLTVPLGTFSERFIEL